MAPLYCSRGHENLEDSRFCRQCGEQLHPGREINQVGIVGKTLSARYRVVQELGHGGFGRTYLAEDTNRFSEHCVLKEFAPQVQGTRDLQKAQELFEREAGTLYQLQHPQIPRFRELFRTDIQGQGRLFLVQDYVDGQTYQAILRSRLNQGFCFSETEVTQLLLQLLPVLTYIHDRGVIHRDISPDNLIWRSADGLPVLIDFGGVKQVAAEVMSQVNPVRVPSQPVGATLLGKIGYAPVEQMSRGEAFPHSDLYALAMTVLVLLTGKEPQLLLDHNDWQQQVSLSPKLKAILKRMLEVAPSHRYQSAKDVIQALHGSVPAPHPNITQPPVEHTTAHQYPATIAVAPPAATQVSQTATVTAAPYRKHRSGSGFGFLFSLVLMVGLVAGGWWAGTRWILPLLPLSQGNQVNPPKPKPQSTNSPKPASPFSKAEQARKQALDKRREDLGIDSKFLVSLVNQMFYGQYPELGGRQLSQDKKDEALRADWDKVATDLLDKLQTISPEARSRLGQYTDASIKERQAAVNQINLSSRALNDLTDAQFFHLFPLVNADFLKQPVGQVWQAIASDQLKALQAGTILENFQFAEGGFSGQVNGSLKPGQGKAYLAKFNKDQTLRLKLQTDSPVRISFYPPSSKNAALLEDSDKTEWSGKLETSGLYEVVITSPDSNASYTLDLSAADDVTTEGSEAEKKPN